MDISSDSISDASESEWQIFNRQREDDIDAVLNAQNNFWEMFTQLFLDKNLELNCLEKMAALINAVPGNQFKVPTSRYLILQEFCKSKFPVHFWIFCEACAQYVSYESGQNKFYCRTCNTQLSTQANKYFITISTIPQLQKILTDHWEEIVGYQSRNNEKGIISDISHGSILMSMNQNNPFNLKLSLILNTDGVQIFKSTTKSLWPIQFICNFLPPNLRFHQKNIIVSGLYFDNTKPDMLNFFEPIGKEFNDINENGIAIHLKENSFKVKVHITHCCVDLPAQSMVQKIILYSGYNSCTECMHYGVSIKNEKNDKKYVRYIWRGVIEKPRTRLQKKR